MRMDFYQIIVSSQTNTKTFFSGREGGEEKEQGRADSVEVSDQLIVAVAAKLLVKARTQHDLTSFPKFAIEKVPDQINPTEEFSNRVHSKARVR